MGQHSGDMTTTAPAPASAPAQAPASRLRDRVLNLQKHFGQASDDISQILISADKVAKRGGRIESLEFDGEETAAEARVVIPAPIGRKRTAAE